MPIKSWYVLNTAAPSPNYFGQLQDSGTAPTDAACSFGYGPGKLAARGLAVIEMFATGTGGYQLMMLVT